ncbi:MAG TPA: hypothetical protein VIZ61_04125 [Solirubrobacterales bacterium]
MPAIIDSSPACITHNTGAVPADDSADFILQANFQDCAGIMTFGPGTVYGPDGNSAASAYYALTYIGIFVTIAVLIAWVVVENRRLVRYVRERRRSAAEGQR